MSGHEHSLPSDQKSWALGMIYLMVKIAEENSMLSEVTHLIFSIGGALLIVALSHFFSMYLKYKFSDSEVKSWKIWKWKLFKKK
jgi:hypothetical protein